MEEPPIYLDNNATTRPSPGVVSAVHLALERWWANPSSVHRLGQEARHALERARQDIADLLDARPAEITFTSGGTESIDLAIRGVLGARSGADTPVVVSTRVEHAAVRDLLEELQRTGRASVVWAPVDPEGIVDLAALDTLLPGAALATIQWANNETGGIQPVEEIARLCRRHGVLFHTDATQWVGKEPVSLGTMPAPCDLLTFAPHKFHGPKGVGVLWTARGVGWRPSLLGTQERGRRGGTENVPGILGAAAAAREARLWLDSPEPRARLAALRDRFEQRIREGVPDVVINGPLHRRLWNTTNIGFPRLEAEALLLLLSERGLCASAGAACSSGSLEPSPVLLAMGVPREVAHGSLRFSLSRDTTPQEIDRAAQIVIAAVHTLRGSSSALAGPALASPP